VCSLLIFKAVQYSSIQNTLQCRVFSFSITDLRCASGALGSDGFGRFIFVMKTIGGGMWIT